MITQQVTYPLEALLIGLNVVFGIRGLRPNFHPVSYFSIILVAFRSYLSRSHRGQQFEGACRRWNGGRLSTIVKEPS